MSKKTAATSKIQITSKSRVLMLAFELGEESWLLGFSAGFGEQVSRKKIASRDTEALQREIARAKKRLGPS